MVHYQLESEWAVTAPVEKVFDLLAHAETFLDWWPSVTDSHVIEPGDSAGIGRVVLYRLRSPLLYSLRFRARITSIELPRRIEFNIRGDLMGTGIYLIDATGDGSSVVRVFWYVSTTKRWINALPIVTKPLFVWSHNRLMNEGARAMARRLGAHVVSSETYVVDTRSAVA